jgi:hypothetical protein
MTKEESTTVLAKWDTDSSKTVDFREFCFMFAGIIKVRLAMVASGAVRSELCFTSWTVWTVTKRSPSVAQAEKDDVVGRAEDSKKMEAAATAVAEVSDVTGCMKCLLGSTVCCMVVGICFAPCTLGLSMVPSWCMAKAGKEKAEAQIQEQRKAVAALQHQRAEVKAHNQARAKKTLLAGPTRV